jgi:Peptidase propeptide and YPEB domain
MAVWLRPSVLWLFVRCIVMLTAPLSVGAHALGPPVKEEKPGLRAKATVKLEAARLVAQRRVPLGRIVKAEIEEEKGRLVYSFDFKTKAVGGIDEVTVDACTGEVVSVHHEGAEDEKRERAEEKSAGMP